MISIDQRIFTVLKLSQLMTLEFGEHWNTSPGVEHWE